MEELSLKQSIAICHAGHSGILPYIDQLVNYISSWKILKIVVRKTHSITSLWMPRSPHDNPFDGWMRVQLP
ncbi:hypothetical protein Sjap_010173 [Stephania japonica]|uniref:Uncharacterized protein n=1 Tax=Stephania japonica TaxID=461633 RepID=A0AAP0P6W3_9MAGN